MAIQVQVLCIWPFCTNCVASWKPQKGGAPKVPLLVLGLRLRRETDVNIRNKKGINMRNCAIGSTVGSILLFVVGVILAVIALRNSI